MRLCVLRCPAIKQGTRETIAHSQVRRNLNLDAERPSKGCISFVISSAARNLESFAELTWQAKRSRFLTALRSIRNDTYQFQPCSSRIVIHLDACARVNAQVLTFERLGQVPSPVFQACSFSGTMWGLRARNGSADAKSLLKRGRCRLRRGRRCPCRWSAPEIASFPARSAPQSQSDSGRRCLRNSSARSRRR